MRRSLLVLVLAGIVGCGSSAPPPASAKPAETQASGLPETVADVDALRAKGVTWTNVAIREHYLKLVARIGPANEQWKKEHLGAEARARKAFGMRNEARIVTRRMMSDPQEIENLRGRDQRRFGNPEGPTFEALVEQKKKASLSGDAVYEAIIVSSQKTDPIVNELVGPSEP